MESKDDDAADDTPRGAVAFLNSAARMAVPSLKPIRRVGAAAEIRRATEQLNEELDRLEELDRELVTATAWAALLAFHLSKCNPATETTVNGETFGQLLARAALDGVKPCEVPKS
jgi:hypothetical protein